MPINTITVQTGDNPPTDREEIVTIPKSQLKAIIEDAVAEAAAKFELMFIRAMGEASGKGEKWLNTAAAAVVLGKKTEQLREMVKDGRLRVGIEVRDDRPENAINPVYVFDIPKCEKRLLTPPEKRGNK